jgi:hypothetical protein
LPYNFEVAVDETDDVSEDVCVLVLDEMAVPETVLVAVIDTVLTAEINCDVDTVDVSELVAVDEAELLRVEVALEVAEEDKVEDGEVTSQP